MVALVGGGHLPLTGVHQAHQYDDGAHESDCFACRRTKEAEQPGRSISDLTHEQLQLNCGKLPGLLKRQFDVRIPRETHSKNQFTPSGGADNAAALRQLSSVSTKAACVAELNG